MPRPTGYCWRLVLIPLAILILLICAGPALAGSIYVFDGSAFGGGVGSSFFINGLIGERGFTLSTFGQPTVSFYPTNAFVQCGKRDFGPAPPFDHRCHPGQVLGLSEVSPGSPDVSGHATLDGNKYAVGGPFDGVSGFSPPTQCFPSSTSIFCTPSTSTVQVSFQAPSVIAPPFSAAVCDPPFFRCSATLTAPFILTGSFTHLDSATGQIVNDPLVGSGIARLFLNLESRDDEKFWRFSGQAYDINPTPEPATLILVGTGAAGVGLARWWKRRRT